MKSQKYKVIAFAAILTLNIPSYAQDSAVREKMKAALDSQAITPEYIQNPANRVVVAALRDMPPSHPKAYPALLKANDPVTVAACLGQFEMRWHNVARAIALSGNPKLIAPLVQFLIREESPKAPPPPPGVERDMAIDPVSVVAAGTIASIVVNCPQFPAPVVQWAKTIAPGSSAGLNKQQIQKLRQDTRSGEHRAQVRRWWVENKELIVAGRYSETKPPSAGQ